MKICVGFIFVVVYIIVPLITIIMNVASDMLEDAGCIEIPLFNTSNAVSMSRGSCLRSCVRGVLFIVFLPL